MDLGLSERVYVLTGASRGLGFAAAEALVADGARVVISARDKATVDEAVSLLGGLPHAVGLAADLRDPSTPARLIEAATTGFGRIDGALISVGGPPRGTVAAVSDETWRESFETVFLGTVRATRVIGEALGPGGAIALVLSSSARTPLTGLGVSNGLRPGLAAAAKDMAEEWGPRGVRVVSLLPGRILTDRALDIYGGSEAALARAETPIPLGRIGKPVEFGRVAAFVLSPAASYITGTSIMIDGGLTPTL